MGLDLGENGSLRASPVFTSGKVRGERRGRGQKLGKEEGSGRCVRQVVRHE